MITKAHLPLRIKSFNLVIPAGLLNIISPPTLARHPVYVFALSFLFPWILCAIQLHAVFPAITGMSYLPAIPAAPAGSASSRTPGVPSNESQTMRIEKRKNKNLLPGQGK